MQNELVHISQILFYTDDGKLDLVLPAAMTSVGTVMSEIIKRTDGRNLIHIEQRGAFIEICEHYEDYGDE